MQSGERWSTVEACGVMTTAEGHSLKDFFLPGVATVDDVVGSSAVCLGGFGKKDGEK